jgi:hypothetical protein
MNKTCTSKTYISKDEKVPQENTLQHALFHRWQQNLNSNLGSSYKRGGKKWFN